MASPSRPSLSHLSRLPLASPTHYLGNICDFCKGGRTEGDVGGGGVVVGRGVDAPPGCNSQSSISSTISSWVCCGAGWAGLGIGRGAGNPGTSAVMGCGACFGGGGGWAAFTPARSPVLAWLGGWANAALLTSIGLALAGGSVDLGGVLALAGLAPDLADCCS